MRKLSAITILVATIMFAACKKQDSANVTERPVVIAYLTPGQPVGVKVYQQKGLADTATYGAAITGLSLSLSNGSQTVALTESGSGNYVYNNTSFLSSGKTYTLKFNYLNEDVTATTNIPAKATSYTASRTTINMPLTTINGPAATDSIAVTFRWSNPDSLYHVIVFKNDDNSPYNLHPQRNSPVNFTIDAKTADHYDVYYRTFSYLGVYRAILYSVDKAYGDILSSNANTTSQRLANPPGNITNGYGIFAGMQADTIKLTLTQY
ncbi:DUF4249 family protein [Mucilaginibacter mali]|uniref:DUF4249 family protein n=1 Tax=Mucilaginibacter mali TaxID=2740462 RepID=A0A7D4ULU4_9SPHI|nr:DUF4249 family protein [Mucilaginibacter mali]QKJ30401.1 DUF4249 family protein [Mucilaginibacter mali]